MNYIFCVKLRALTFLTCLADLLGNSVACFLQGDVMDACKQITPGVVVALVGAAWGTKGQLKVSRCKQV
jgi:hypothetical protein